MNVRGVAWRHGPDAGASDQESGPYMISRTSWAHRQATAILAAHASASSREGTSMIENPPMTALVSGNGDRKSDVQGKSVDRGGRRIIKKINKHTCDF